MMLSAIGDAVIALDAGGLVCSLNPVAERLTGWTAEAARGVPLTRVFRQVDLQTRQPLTSTACDDAPPGAVPGPTTTALLASREGREFVIERNATAVHVAQGAMVGTVQVFRDVTEHQRLRGAFEHSASHDALIGLVNRAEFQRRLDGAFVAARYDVLV